MNLTLAQIEDALLARLQTTQPMGLVKHGGYSRTIESYEGQFEQVLEEVLVLFPCVFAALVQEQVTRLTNEESESVSLWTVLVGDRNLRGQQAARRGDVQSIGTYRMMDDARDLLQGHDLGFNDLDPFQLVRRVAVVNRRDLSVYALEFSTRYVFADM